MTIRILAAIVPGLTLVILIVISMVMGGCTSTRPGEYPPAYWERLSQEIAK